MNSVSQMVLFNSKRFNSVICYYLFVKPHIFIFYSISLENIDIPLNSAYPILPLSAAFVSE